MSTNKKFRIQNGVDVSNGDISINDVTVIGADGKVVPAAIADAVAGLTSSDIADLQAQVSTILGTSPETLDTLQEIVAAFEGADSTLTGSVAQNASDIATINTTLTNGVATPTDVADLQSQVTSNDTDIAANAAAIAAANSRTSGISTSSGSSNIQMTAEVDMDGNAVTNMADPSSAQDAATKAYVDAASTSSSSDLSAEEAARIAGDAASVSTASADATSKADAAEASAKAHADSGDASLQGQIDIIVGSSPSTLDTLQEIVSAFEGADSTLTGAVAQNSSDIAAETTRATAAEAVNAAAIAAANARTAGISQNSSGPESGIHLMDDVHMNSNAITNMADPSSAQDAATKAYVDTASASSGSDLSTETAARIAGDLANTDEVNVETARAVAVEGSLQTQIDTVSSSGVSGRQVLQNAVDAEEAARIAADAVLQANIDAEASTRAGADNTLQSNIDTVSAAVSAITNGSPETLNQLTELVAAYEGADQSLQTLIDNLGGDASALTGRVSTLESEMNATESATSSNTSSITAEAVARSAADDDLQDAIDAEATARAAAVSAETSARQNAITGETNARILADNGLQSQIDALDNSTTGDKSNLQAQITSNDNDIAALQTDVGTKAAQTALDAEITRAMSAESALASDISDEETRATAAEQSNAAAIAQEITDRTSGDSALQSQINSIVSNTDPAALDSLTEIVAAFQAADGSITGVVNSNTSRITSLEGGVSAIEAWDTDNVSEGSTNLYFTEARAKACVGADVGSCIDYVESTGKFSLDLSETAGALVPDNSTNSDKLDGQHGSHYRIDVYDVNGTVVN